MKAALTFGIFWLALLACAQETKTAALTVENATIGKDGRVHLTWSGQPEQVMARDRGGYCESGPKECEDAGAEQMFVSSDRRSVGWTADYNGCCESYPIPMVLVIARDGKIVQRIQRPMAIWRWRFEDGDGRVAVFSDTTHGRRAPVCALYDTRTWKVIDEWHRGKSATLPAWAKPFADAIGPTADQGGAAAKPS